MPSKSLLPLLLASATCLPSGALGQTTWYVDAAAAPTGTGSTASPYASIQYAIERPTTVNGDTVLVRPGVYVENVDFSSSAPSEKSLTLESTEGPLVTTITAAGVGPVVVLGAGALRGFTLTGGLAGSAGIRTRPPTIPGPSTAVERCIVIDNSGPGVFFEYDCHALYCTIAGNSVGFDPGAQGFLTLRNSIVWGNAVPTGALPGLSNACTSITQNPYLGNATAPEFWDLAGRDLHLAPGSPAIQAGFSLTCQFGTPADIGALPYDSAYAPGPVSYCTSKLNSQGCSPAIGSIGVPSAAGAPFAITCSNVLNNKVGLFFYGYSKKGTPYQGGWLCVRAPFKRTSLQSSAGNPPPDDCSGVYSFDFDARIQSGVDRALVAGALVYAQWWYRDPLDPTGFATGRSDAICFGIAP